MDFLIRMVTLRLLVEYVKNEVEKCLAEKKTISL